MWSGTWHHSFAAVCWWEIGTILWALISIGNTGLWALAVVLEIHLRHGRRSRAYLASFPTVDRRLVGTIVWALLSVRNAGVWRHAPVGISWSHAMPCALSTLRGWSIWAVEGAFLTVGNT